VELFWFYMWGIWDILWKLFEVLHQLIAKIFIEYCGRTAKYHIVLQQLRQFWGNIVAIFADKRTRRSLSGSQTLFPFFLTMVLIASWDEFSRAAERLYLNNPDKCRFILKSRHKDGKLYVKISDNATTLQYETEVAQDVKRVEKLTSSLMKAMLTQPEGSKHWWRFI